MGKHFTAQLPWPHKNLHPNHSKGLHWGAVSRARKSYKAACMWALKEAKVRSMTADSVSLAVTFHPPTRHARDKDNLIAAFKSGQDAISAVLGVDDSKFDPTYEIAPEPIKGGRVTVNITIPEAAE